MLAAEFEVGLFQVRPEGVSLVGRSRNPDLIEMLREELAAERRRELACLGAPNLREVHRRAGSSPAGKLPRRGRW